MHKSDGPDSPGNRLRAGRVMGDESDSIHVADDAHALGTRAHARDVDLDDLDGFRFDGFLRGRDTIRDFETAEVGDVSGKSLLHLQCHTGLDTLSWARRGASPVVGLDFSEPAVDAARDLAADAAFTADRAAFVAADVYDAAEAVPDTSYDIVYSGPGALGRLPDIPRWAEIAASLVAPGGFLYLAELHPLAAGPDDEYGARLVHDSTRSDPWADEPPDPYADLDALSAHHGGSGWQHPVGEVVSALADAGLRIEFLHEHDVTVVVQAFPSLRRGDDGLFRLPQDRPGIPLMYSVLATRP
ncbi:class I SAM-dependent methyltransferase [Streptomyces sp. NPDC048639]|uniref:class I SAM-dependent methyltransferase n=1 Tax=Streptomyces sp. NPDC048639 TaxID=3365581 RepID=UPI003719E3C4